MTADVGRDDGIADGCECDLRTFHFVEQRRLGQVASMTVFDQGLDHLGEIAAQARDFVAPMIVHRREVELAFGDAVGSVRQPRQPLGHGAHHQPGDQAAEKNGENRVDDALADDGNQLRAHRRCVQDYARMADDLAANGNVGDAVHHAVVPDLLCPLVGQHLVADFVDERFVVQGRVRAGARLAVMVDNQRHLQIRRRLEAIHQFIQSGNVIADQPGGRIDGQGAGQTLALTSELIQHELPLAGDHVGDQQAHQHRLQQHDAGDDAAANAMKEEVDQLFQNAPCRPRGSLIWGGRPIAVS